MTDQADDPRASPPPTDVERLQVMARLIHRRIQELSTAKAKGSFTPGNARELEVLLWLRDEWLFEGRT